MTHPVSRFLCATLIGLAGLAHGGSPESSSGLAPGEFARVGGTVISAQEYDAALREAGRQKFYHGKPSEGAVDDLRREVGDKLIDRVLLLKEAQRRGMKPDRTKIEQTVAGYDRQYAASEQWQRNREQMLPGLVQHLESQNLVEQVEQQARAIPEPTPEAIRAFYDRNGELFTEPEQVRISLIMLKVDPASPTAVWEKAHQEAQAILKRLQDGADFAELAKIHSADRSAATGGDLGYVHRGMLPEAAQETIDKLKPGELSEPIVVLEGIAIVRLEDRKPARKRAFEDVKARATDLARREIAEEQWRRFLKELRAGVPIVVDESRYPSPGSSEKK